MDSPYFSLEAVYLRGITREDFTSNLLNWSNDQEVTHYMYTGIRPGVPEAMDKLYEQTASAQDEVVFTIVAKDSERAIGLSGLYAIKPQARHAEFRIIMGDKSYWGRGIGTAVTRQVVDYGFKSLNLNKVWLGVNRDNQRAFKSYEQVGFKQEGVLRDEIFRNGRYYDAVRMSVLASEWQT